MSNKITEWCLMESYVQENLFVKKLREHFTDDKIELILDILDNTCLFCFDGEKGCWCSRE